MHEKNNIHPIQIGGITIPNNLWLAPLAGYSMKALRLFCKQFGAGFAVTEMVSLEGLVREDKRTWSYVDVEGEDDVAVQLFGKNEPDKYYKAARMILARTKTKIIDVNFGCPVRKVIRTGSGSALLKTPEAMTSIIKAVKDAGAIASAKVRSGFDHVTIEQTMEALEKGQPDIITVHPRLATQFYNGTADWSVIAKAREMTKAILFASGDVKTPENAEEVLKLTRSDGVMIGRQAVGSPYIFKQIIDYFSNGIYTSYTLDEIKAIMTDFAGLFISLQKKDWIVPIRSALIQYVRNYQNSREIRGRLSGIESIEELTAVLKDW